MNVGVPRCEEFAGSPVNVVSMDALSCIHDWIGPSVRRTGKTKP